MFFTAESGIFTEFSLFNSFGFIGFVGHSRNPKMNLKKSYRL